MVGQGPGYGIGQRQGRPGNHSPESKYTSLKFRFDIALPNCLRATHHNWCTEREKKNCRCHKQGVWPGSGEDDSYARHELWNEHSQNGFFRAAPRAHSQATQNHA